MAKILLIANDYLTKARYLEKNNLPIFYMEDFSIQGVAVDQFETSWHLLSQAGYTVLDKNGAADIILHDATELSSIQSFLQRHGVQVELTDIADTIYQA